MRTTMIDQLDDLDLFIEEQTDEDPGFADALRDAELRARCVAQLVELRRTSGLTQKDVAAAMNTAQSAVSEFERGSGDVYVSTLQRYARAVGSAVRVAIPSAPTVAGGHCGYGSQAISAPIDIQAWKHSKGVQAWSRSCGSALEAAL